MFKAGDPLAKRIRCEKAERMFLASFVSDLSGVPSRQVRYASPRELEQALNIALLVQEAER
jgi:hypothetical protein